MLTASRAFHMSASAGEPLPQVDFLRDLYRMGVTPRRGELTMIAGRPGHQKSGFALAWAAAMNLSTLYFSADMSQFQASSRLACNQTGRTLEQVQLAMKLGSEDIEAALARLKITFWFQKPITFTAIEKNLRAYVELHGNFPELLIFDNLMDFEFGESDYAAQMAVLQDLDALRSTMDVGAGLPTMFVLHHATDKSDSARKEPHMPPARGDIKGGLGEKPELTLGVAIDPTDLSFRVAPLKVRMGPGDPSGKSFAVLRADPAKTRFTAMGGHGA